jgi:adenylate cyclase
MTGEGKRLLAAIMFTDMVGYTALMQEDERQAIINRDRHRKILQDATATHKGEILQYYGDGTLIIFNSAIEAAECALEIQTELLKEPKIPLRIGMHIGDIVYNDEGIYGDGVNVASRIEGLSSAGCILISDRMADEIKNHHQFKCQSIGSFDLKNVNHPVEIFAITNKGLTIPAKKELSSTQKVKQKSIAVLPFVNMSSDTENEYFSDGITEELLNALTKVEGLLVTARTSSFQFKGQSQDVREIGKQLGVETILEGSVRKAGNRLRITAQLIKTVDGYHVWSNTYDRQLEDIFEIQDEISLKISNALREKLCPKEDDEKLVAPSTRNMEAYNLYLKARYYQNKWSLTTSKKAIELLEQAIQLDPNFALAYVLLSGAYGYLGATGKLLPGITFPKSKEYALKAIQMDDSLPESHLALSNIYFWGEWDWKKTIFHVNKAIKLNPSFAEAYQYKSLYLIAFCKFKEALVNINLSLQLNPFSAPASLILSMIYFFMGKLDKSEAQLFKTEKIDPEFSEVVKMKGFLYRYKKEYEKAIPYFEEIKKIPGNEPEAISNLGAIYLKQGKPELAQKCLEELLQFDRDTPDMSIFIHIGLLYFEMEDFDNMFLYFEKSLEAREGDTVFINTYQPFKPFRSDPRYINLVEKMGLTDILKK